VRVYNERDANRCEFKTSLFNGQPGGLAWLEVDAGIIAIDWDEDAKIPQAPEHWLEHGVGDLVNLSRVPLELGQGDKWKRMMTPFGDVDGWLVILASILALDMHCSFDDREG